MAKKSLALALSVAAMALSSAPAAAATVVQDLSTGRAGFGQGPRDGNWTIGGPTGANPFIATSIPATWAGGTSGGGTSNNNDLASFDASSSNASRWITATASGTTNVAFGSTLRYGTVFTLPSIGEFVSAALTVAFWADNRVTDIFLNGNRIGGQAYPASGDPTDFAPSGKVVFTQLTGFNPGTVNRLEFDVFNGGTSNNPSGFRAEISNVVTSVPEPGTWMLLLLGFGAIGFSMRFRQKSQGGVQFA